MGAPVISWFSAIAVTSSSTGLVRSRYLDVSEPRSIFSKPRASTQSLLPVSMSCFARNSAVEPVEQLLFTL
uniref:Putative secreted protein n=1 Tax=Anopheles triannulatus TaxID=58253 RepID=A0A2M4B4G7_9DIPT